MKVLRNNYENKSDRETKIEPYPRRHICEYCESELEYEESDLRMGYYGVVHLDCPVCGNESMLEENEHTIILTKDNVEFPTHFWHFSKKAGAVDVLNNDNVKRLIQEGINYFRKNKNEFAWFTSSGNTFVGVYNFKDDEEYMIVVSGDRYETSIPFEPEDY